MPRDSRRDPRYDILFEPIDIGPVTAKNRFYQVPHCNGMGYRDPTALAWMRGVKAEGGWAVVCTEQVELHHTSDITPYIELRLWDDRDIPMLARMADRVHEFGALAGIELAYNGLNAPNSYGREVPMAPTALPVMTFTYDPVQARAMTRRDIRDLRRWHRAAALRARRAGFDLVYVYAGHALTVLHHFLSRRYNQRTDEYGGSLENRVRLLKEVLIDTREAVGDTCAVPCRISMDELLGEAMAAMKGRGEIVVLSDHGFAPYERSFNLNTWLLREGYLQVREGIGEEEASLLEGTSIAWERTAAYGLGLNALYLNLRGREDRGAVAPEDGDSRLRELAEKLLALRDPRDGRQVVERVYRVEGATADGAAPDLLIGYARGYRASGAAALGRIEAEVLSDNHSPWSGDHCMAAHTVPGVLVSSLPLRPGAAPHLRDLPVSILEHYGIGRPAAMTGRPVWPN